MTEPHVFCHTACIRRAREPHGLCVALEGEPTLSPLRGYGVECVSLIVVDFLCLAADCLTVR